MSEPTETPPTTERGTTTPTTVAVPTQESSTAREQASPGGPDDKTRNARGFYLVRNSVYAVGALFVVGTIGAVVVGYTGGGSSTISATLTAVTGVIGSLVGAYSRIQVGNAGRQETEGRAEGRRQDAQETLNKALAVLPREDAATLLNIDLPRTEKE